MFSILYTKLTIDEPWHQQKISRSNMDFCMAEKQKSEGVNEYV